MSPTTIWPSVLSPMHQRVLDPGSDLPAGLAWPDEAGGVILAKDAGRRLADLARTDARAADASPEQDKDTGYGQEWEPR